MSYHYDYDNFLNEKGESAVKKTTSPVHHIKKLLERVLKKTHKRRDRADRALHKQEIADNDANEILENEIFEEVDRCEAGAAVAVFEDGERRLMAVSRGQRYVPVRFARTDAGTFFWASAAAPPDADVCRCGDRNAMTACQAPEMQARDRWAQA